MLPIETKARELHAKLLLACFAAEHGWGVVLGGKSSTKKNRELLPTGVFLEKSITPGTIRDISRTLAAGHRVSAWCEEGLIYFNPEDYRERRIEQESFDALDYFFTWGAKQAEDILVGTEKGREKLVISGNPRFDLLRPEFRSIFNSGAESIKRRYGKIILINTKFITLNSENPEARRDPIAYMRKTGRIRSQKQEDLFRKVIQLQQHILPAFLDLFPILSREFSDYTIIVRPHPSESDTPWLEGAKGLSNVKVIFEGNVNEWILASDVTIQNNCTTGIEAFLLGKPSISYRPYKDEEAEFQLPNIVGFQAESQKELISLIRSIIEKKISTEEKYREQIESTKYYIANIDGKPACEIIVDTLDKLDLPLSEANFPIKRPGLVNYLRRIKENLFPHITKKFPGVRLKEMEHILGEIRESSGKFSDIKIVPVDIGGFAIYKI